MAYDLRELSKDEGDALTKDLQEVLEKHNCEMGVTSAIQLLKRVEKEEATPSPAEFQINNGENPETKTD